MPENLNPADGDKGPEGDKPADGGKPATTPEVKTLTMTQAELDQLIESRLARAKPKDYDELVALRDKVKADEDAKKDELTKAQEARAKAEADAKAALEQANGILRRAAIIAEASAQNAVDPEIVVALLAGAETITVEGTEVKGVKQAVKKLLEDKPYLVKASGPAPASGGQFGGNDPRTIAEQIREAESKGDWATARRLKSAQLVSR